MLAFSLTRLFARMRLPKELRHLGIKSKDISEDELKQVKKLQQSEEMRREAEAHFKQSIEAYAEEPDQAEPSQTIHEDDDAFSKLVKMPDDQSDFLSQSLKQQEVTQYIRGQLKKAGKEDIQKTANFREGREDEPDDAEEYADLEGNELTTMDEGPYADFINGMTIQERKAFYYKIQEENRGAEKQYAKL
mmetsp:Transcript_23741/g.42034  ORF Transcript_23741/g.42034 Transcript_23741/m.42034 type:complete len:190 (+) Transcript_23741:23-592(+)